MSVTKASDGEKELFMDLADRLQQLREAAGITQQSISTTCRCSKDHISEIERGQARLTIFEMLAYCRRLHITPNDLLDYESNDLSTAEIILLNKFRKLDDDKQKAIIEFISV